MRGGCMTLWRRAMRCLVRDWRRACVAQDGRGGRAQLHARVPQGDARRPQGGADRQVAALRRRPTAAQ
eukprot:scaffold66826_cov45-Phaeocystis_antarctica.AAC.1